MALEDARMEQQPLLESARDVRTKQPLADKGFGAFDVKIVSNCVRRCVSTPGGKNVSVLCGETAAEQKAAKKKMKGKKASERIERNVTYCAVIPTDGDVDVTASAPAPARSPAKRVFLKNLGPLVRCRVLNTILKDLFKPSTPVSRENDMVVDGVLTDLPRVTRSEPTAAIPPKLEDMWMQWR